jgi:hypothetical protein
MKEQVTYFKDKEANEIVTEMIVLGNVVTPKIEHIFSFGQCHALAVALHEILGWEVMGSYNPYGDDRSTRHFVVKCPNHWGDADIHGIRCCDHGLRKANPEVILGGRARKFFPPAMGLARHYAPIIAAGITEQWEALKEGKPKPRWTICSEGYVS